MANAKQYFPVFVIIFIAVQQSKADKFYLQSSQVQFDRLYIEDINITINPGNLSLNMIFSLAQDQPSDAWFDIRIDIRNRRVNKYRRLYQSEPISFCELSKNPNWFKDLLKNLIKRGGMDPDKCPLKKAIYTFTNLSAENMNAPAFLSGAYRVSFLSSFRRGGKKLVSNITVYWIVK